MKAVFALTSSESKRLIAKSILHLKIFQEALKTARIFLAAGTTNVFVAEEALKENFPDKWRYCFGLTVDGFPCISSEKDRESLFVLEKGIRSDSNFREGLKSVAATDLFIKGANAVDSARRVGVLVNHKSGGTVGFARPFLEQSGATTIIPVGLEKIVPSVPDAVKFAGPDDLDYSFGYKNWLMEIDLKNQVVVTEIEAIQELTGASAQLLAAGGIGGSEGSVVLGITGTEQQVLQTLEMIRSIKGEPCVTGIRQSCGECSSPCLFIS